MERGWARNACAWKSHAEDAAAVVGAVAAAIWTGVTADVTSLAGIATGAHMATVAVTTIAEGDIHHAGPRREGPRQGDGTQGPAHARLDTEVATDVQEVPIETSTLCDPRTPAASLDNSLQASKAFTCTCIDIFPILMLRLVVNDVSFHESHASVFVQGEASKRCTYYSEFQMILSYSSHISRCF